MSCRLKWSGQRADFVWSALSNTVALSSIIEDTPSFWINSANSGGWWIFKDGNQTVSEDMIILAFVFPENIIYELVYFLGVVPEKRV